MSQTDRFTDPAAHPLTADLVARLESAEAAVEKLSSRLRIVEALALEIRPRPNADLKMLSQDYSARVVGTKGDFASLPKSILGKPVFIHHPKRHGMKLYAYSNIRHGEPLHIVFHGAMINSARFPRFERVRSMNEAGLSFASIADPTIQLDYNLKLGWYLGSDAFDPLDWIVDLVSTLVALAKPSQLVFTGSSGGGFASLQVARRFPGSLAFVTDPQTVVQKYREKHVRRLLHTGFHDLSPEAALDAFRERFSAVAALAQAEPEHFVYYTQHRWDAFHIDNHLKPFAGALGIENPVEDCENDLFKLAMIDQGRHGPLTPGDFNDHLARAKEWHRERLSELG